MSKPSRKPKPLRCPLNKEQQQQVKKIADTVDKHKRIIRKLSPI